MIYYKVEDFQGENGEHIKKLIRKDADAPTEDTPSFIGTVVMEIRGLGRIPVSWDFPDDYDLDQCFAAFENMARVEAQKVVEELQKAQSEKHIITPQEAAAGGLIIP